MDEDKTIESDNLTVITKSDVEVKTEPSEEALPSSDFIPLQTSSKPTEDVTNPIPKQNNGNEKNAQKRINPIPDDGNGKKPRKSTPEAPSQIIKKTVSYEIDNLSDTEEYYLTVSNLPNDWTYVQIKNYLDQVFGHIDEMEMVKQKNSQYCAVRLTFQSSETCRDAFNKLKNKVIEGVNLEVEISEPISSFPPSNDISTSTSNQGDGSDTTEMMPLRPWRPDQDVWETDPKGLYGLRPQFLKSLKITPPIDRWVHVSNFRCDKTELKEVMELAGNVLMCCVVPIVQRYAKVMYSHPLEAVQAISMLNGQIYYGKPLKVMMDRNPKDTLVLPKGLANVGVGLGLQGRPVRNIAQEFQRYAKKQSTLINPIVFSKINTDDGSENIFTNEEDNDEEIQNKINEFMKSIQNSKLPSSLKVKNVDELDSCETNSKDGSNNSPDTNVAKASPGESRKLSVGSLSPPQDAKAKNGSGKQNNNSNKPVPLMKTPSLLGTTVPVRLCQPSPRGFPRPGMLHNTPVPTPGHPNYGPGPNNFANPRPGPFGPRPAPFMPVQGPAFRPQPIPPAPFAPAPGIRPQMPPANFSGPRPFVGPNPGNRVTVHFANLPPSTTFPLLCEKLAQCGQVMSVQLTTPGCAVATFGHPSHADRCFQTFNRMNIEGYVIEVTYA